jgi:hypothetical protein
VRLRGGTDAYRPACAQQSLHIPTAFFLLLAWEIRISFSSNTDPLLCRHTVSSPSERLLTKIVSKQSGDRGLSLIDPLSIKPEVTIQDRVASDSQCQSKPYF